MREYLKLLTSNKEWAKKKVQQDPTFFLKLLETQKPKFLWIGCADSRVPAEQIVSVEPGELFVHRNIANMVVNTDLNLLSVIQYAVEVLEIKHVIVCGHYGCGGVKASLANNSLGLIDNWLRNIKDVYRLNATELNQIEDQELKLKRMIELNVKEQVINLSNNAIIQKQWKKSNYPFLHGWVYSLKDGLVNPLIEVAPHEHLSHDLYKYSF